MSNLKWLVGCMHTKKWIYNFCEIFCSSESTHFWNAFCKDLFKIRVFFLKANLSIALAYMTLTWKLTLQNSASTLSTKVFSLDVVTASATAIFGPFHLKLITCGVFSKYIWQRTCLSLLFVYECRCSFASFLKEVESLLYFGLE